MPMRRRVVITGMGVITPLGHTVKELFESQVAGRSGVAPIARFDARRFPTQFPAQVKDFDLGQYLPEAERWANCGVNSQFALAASQQALADAGLLNDEKVDRTRFGLYFGSGEGTQDFENLVYLVGQSYRPQDRSVDRAAFERDALRHFHAGR